ncbi:GGDEF domain-containing protein [Pseudacidovorax intermedius]|uniref:diguanylate cyclase n=1 Tax=Pseudacidovorax intermedius TaxID=433924 RepID=A0A147GLX4_9BURK|nr:GGDEF domain-containing protein [Pseudacidovorax intermedius]KTT14550.1 diguanylate cyclase [Pseudacidovorax intermedius]
MHDVTATATAPDLFDAERSALAAARAVFDAGPQQPAADCHQALGELMGAFDRLLRETRRLVRRSDRSELEMNRLNQRLQDLAAELEYRATHDPLTGVLNRAAIIDMANRHFVSHDLSLVVLDIDHFKRVNDSFGHPTGDQVILGVVDCLKHLVPAGAQVGRVGGEEFTIVLPGWPLERAAQTAQLVRRAIEGRAFGLPDGSRITASFGVSWLARGGSFDLAYCAADEALYAAKRGGRNQVARAGLPAAEPSPASSA